MEDDSKLEQETDSIEKSENETASESNTEAADSAILKTEEKSDSTEGSGEVVVTEDKSESIEGSGEAVVTEDKSESIEGSGEVVVTEDKSESIEGSCEVVAAEEKNKSSEGSDDAAVKEEKSESSDDSVEDAVKEEHEEVKEAEVVESDKESEEKDYAEISEENKACEEITEEAESEDTADAVSDDSNKSEDAKDAVEPEVTEEKEASKENVEDADITQKESSEQKVEEAAVVEKEQIVEEIIVIEEVLEDSSPSSSKPKAVLDELDKLKNVKSQTETTEVKAAEAKEPEKEATKAEEPKIAEETGKESEAVQPPISDSDESEEEEFDFKRVFNKDFWKSFLFDLFFLILCVWFTFMLIQKWFSTREVIIQGTSQVHGSIESGEKTAIGNINILVMGIDSVEGTHRSDTIFVLGVNPSKKKLMMLSIPRDTRVIIEEKGRKINEILPRYGEPTLRAILEDLLKIKITRKVEVGFESFISVVDAIGGVDINIEKPMHYDDNWGNLHIHFNPGMNHLNGQDALRYVRFRKDAMADLGRIKRQQDFVKAVIKKIFSPATIVRLPSIIETAFKYIKTDFTLQEILTLAKGFDTFDVKFSTMSLPGEARYVDKISFFMPYAEEAVAIGNNYFSDLAILEIEKECDFGKVIPKQSKTNRKK